MLSISPPIKGTGRGEYYLALSREDYYLEGGEPPGHWYGEGAKHLGLEGEINKDEFRNVLSGLSPNGSEKLSQNAGDEDRRSGWDLTFSAPKSVSALWAVSDPATRAKIQELHTNAVQSALTYIEENAAWTRRGKDGVERERSEMIFTSFDHGTSRAQEPDVHTHVIAHNVSVRADGTKGNLDSAPIYQHKMAGGAIYRAEFAASLEANLGLKISRDKDSFQVDGVSGELCDHWSTRRKEIKAALEERGLSSAKAASVAALDTRGEKEHLPRHKLFSRWGEEAKAYSFTQSDAKNLTEGTPRARSQAELEESKKMSFSKALEEATRSQSHFTEKDAVRFMAVEAQGKGISSKEVLKTVRQELSHSKDIVPLGVSNGGERFTTREMLQLEKRMLERASLLKEFNRAVSPKTVEAVSKVWASQGKELDAEQKDALSHITAEKGALHTVSGVAGSGKSRMRGAAREVWEKEGYKVIGAALAGKAAAGLESEAGIKSDTIHKTLSNIEKGKETLTPRTVLVVDEAGMVGTRQMSELVRVVEQTGAKLVLVGDERQLQPIEAGGAFEAIQKTVGVSKLTEIRRQKEEWAKRAVHDFADGNASAGLKAYAEKGLLTVSDTRKGAKEELLSEWAKEGVKAPEQNLIFAGSNDEVSDLNAGAQKRRLAAGVLNPRASVESGNTLFMEGDRVLFRRNSRIYGVKNGDLGTIEKIEGNGKMTVGLEGGKKARFSLNEYSHVRLGYAVTTHKGQGVTVDKAYVLAGGSMQDRELTYVQMSRARLGTNVFIDKAEAGKDLTDISRAMSKSHKKGLATTLDRAAKPIGIGRGISWRR